MKNIERKQTPANNRFPRSRYFITPEYLT